MEEGSSRDDWNYAEYMAAHGDEGAEREKVRRGWLDAGTAAAASLMIAVATGLASAVATVAGFVNKDPVLMGMGMVGLTSSIIGGAVLNRMMNSAAERNRR